MKIRLQEIEYGSTNVEKTKQFYQTIFGFETAVDQTNLSVFNLDPYPIDFNISTHLPSQSVCISFLTDNLDQLIERLNRNSVAFEGPYPSHLEMKSISFKDPDGNLIKVNQASALSPNWLNSI